MYKDRREKHEKELLSSALRLPAFVPRALVASSLMVECRQQNRKDGRKGSIEVMRRGPLQLLGVRRVDDPGNRAKKKKGWFTVFRAAREARASTSRKKLWASVDPTRK